MLCEMFFFSAQICLKAIFYKLREVFILTKNLNTSRAPVLKCIETKPDASNIFSSRFPFCQVIKHQSRRVFSAM